MWEIVTVGMSGATVSRQDGVYRKVTDNPQDDLIAEGARMTWLREQGIPAPEVLECRPGLLVTEEVPGRSAAEEWPEEDHPRIIDAIAGLARVLHALPIEGCPFDRRLTTILPEDVLTDRPAEEDLVVCHGDLCLPNVVLDLQTCAVTGVIDTGLLGVADRWTDLALTTQSLADERNDQYGPGAADRFLARYGIAPDQEKITFYRALVDTF
jgi:aminoglycoside phosphotransferase